MVQCSKHVIPPAITANLTYQPAHDLDIGLQRPASNSADRPAARNHSAHSQRADWSAPISLDRQQRRSVQQAPDVARQLYPRGEPTEPADGCRARPAQTALTAPPVVGPFDPDHDRDARSSSRLVQRCRSRTFFWSSAKNNSVATRRCVIRRSGSQQSRPGLGVSGGSHANMA